MIMLRFSWQTLKLPIDRDAARRNSIIQDSKDRFARAAKEVREVWTQNDSGSRDPPQEQSRARKSGQTLRGKDDSHRGSELMSIDGSSEGKGVRKSARKESGGRKWRKLPGYEIGVLKALLFLVGHLENG
jgi:hypothetical protein